MTELRLDGVAMRKATVSQPPQKQDFGAHLLNMDRLYGLKKWAWWTRESCTSPSRHSVSPDSSVSSHCGWRPNLQDPGPGSGKVSLASSG